MNSIKFNQQGIEAILAGRKTQTRRPIEHGEYAIENDMNEHSIEVMSNYCDLDEKNHPELKPEMIKHSKYKVGETVFMQEDGIRIPPLSLKITNIKVERLQDINHIDILKEGIILNKDDKYSIHYDKFVCEWNNQPPYDWNSNPYVFVYEFEVVE